VIELLIDLSVVLLAPVVLIGLALFVIEVRTAHGGCRAHRRFAALRTARHPEDQGPGRQGVGMLSR
jgi:hypothetical protein